MANHIALQYGNLKENDDVIMYEIPKAQTTLIEPEQLEELKRQDPLFLPCQHYKVDETFILIYYKRENGYSSLQSQQIENEDLKYKVAKNLLAIERLIGTQFTTLIHPDNIYINKLGDIKLAHRGIRSVLPPEEFSEVQLLNYLKAIILSLFTDYSFAQINEKSINKLIAKDSFLKNLYQASSLKDLQKFLYKNQSNQSKTTYTKPTKEKGKQNKPKQQVSLLSGILIGILLGMLLLYGIKLMPLSEASSKTEAAYNEKQTENIKLKEQLEQKNVLIDAYQAAVSSDHVKAITLLESIDKLDDGAKKILAEQYMLTNKPVSLLKAAELDAANHAKVVSSLVSLNNKEANQAIQEMKSEAPEVLIEQAWLKKDYDSVIELLKELPDSKRAKFLGANSFIEVNKPDDALKLAEALKDKQLQIESLKKKVDMIKKDDSIKKDDKESQIDKLSEKIKKLED
ncbi:type VII secretion protein EssB/YukC [Virgibacillus ndiopensis]|uniref:type VII secretion protein EssB/YukC n=1 Tax=Virgibacillus ndiopensis TaxID=2004408 RepID=UPI000C072F38|nr:type VII secretion protein EssB/YukC [Virgibacillus ndiopensis]